jgi:hypothetical protein
VLSFLEDKYQGYLKETTAANYEMLLHKRQLPIEVLREHGVAWAADMPCWLVPYRSRAGRIVTMLRYMPWRSENNKWLLPLLGTWLYGLDRLRPMGQRSETVLVLCEGLWDAIALDYHLGLGGQKDQFDVVALHSSGSFRPEYCEYLSGYCQVWLCLDNDQAGRQGVQKVVQCYKTAAPQVSLCSLQWPDRFRDHYDVGDLLREQRYLDFSRFYAKHCRIVVS